MPTPATGELRPLANGWEARIRIDDTGRRKGFMLSAIAAGDEAAARARCTAMAEIAVRVRRAGFADKLEDLLAMAAKARAGKPWDTILSAVDKLAAGTAEPLSQAARVTVKAFGETWRDGSLHAAHPDHVPAIDHTRNEQIARLYVDPVIGEIRVAEVTLDDADLVMSKLPEGKASATRRHVAQYVRRLLGLAVYPGRLRAANPIPKGWLPRVKDAKAKECLYPSEDRALLGHREIPLVRRLAYGFLAREGMRTDELARLTWRDVDLEHGRVDLDANKTDDPRSWDLEPGVASALAIWKARYHADDEPGEHVFAHGGVPLRVDDLARVLRADLKAAGVKREKLYERSASRQPLRAHDLRATFITIALATGRTETWVADRTGHTTSTMINRYRRRARTWKLGPLDALDEAIPDIGVPHERPTAPEARESSGEPGGEIASASQIATPARAVVRSQNPPTFGREGSSPSFGTNRESRGESESSSNATERAPQENGAMMGRSTPGAVEAALAEAIAGAAAAGRFDVVAQLAKELEARRLARAENVVTLDARRRRDKG